MVTSDHERGKEFLLCNCQAATRGGAKRSRPEIVSEPRRQRGNYLTVGALQIVPRIPGFVRSGSGGFIF